MKIKVLGSAAAEGIPALWCECKMCRAARKNGGRDIRRRTSYLIDDDTIVDFGPDAFFQCVDFNIDLQRVKRVLFTHSHADHMNAPDLVYRKRGFSSVSGKIRVFGNEVVMKKIPVLTGLSFGELMIEPRIVRALEKITDGDMAIYPLEANHCGESAGEQALNYIIERKSKRVLIANDTGWWPAKSWARARRFKLDAAFIESTCALRPTHIDCREGHLGANAAVAFRDRLVETGALSVRTPVFVNHFSHNGLALHGDLCGFFKPHGIRVAYDGLMVSL